jgi:hypothetical protein
VGISCADSCHVFFEFVLQVIEPLVAQMRPYLPADLQQTADDHHHPCHEQHQQEHTQHMQQQPEAQDPQPPPQQQQQQQPDFLSEKLTMLLLLQEPSAWGDSAAWADPQQQKQWQQLLDASAVSIVEGEVQYLRQQLMHIEDVLHEGREAAAAAGGDGDVSDGAEAGIGATPSCSSCPFQLDCTIKGCIKGELTAAAVLKPHKAAATAAAAGASHHGMGGGSSSSGCCGSHGSASQEPGVSHACCS